VDERKFSVWTVIFLAICGCFAVWYGVQGLIDGEIKPHRGGTNPIGDTEGIVWSTVHVVAGIGLLCFGTVVLYQRAKGGD